MGNVVAAFPYKIHTVLTDNGMAFADLPKNRCEGPSRRFLGPHVFDRVCIEHGSSTGRPAAKPYHPWTNGQAERIKLNDQERPRSKSSTTKTSKASRRTYWPLSQPTTSPST